MKLVLKLCAIAVDAILCNAVLSALAARQNALRG